MLVQRWEILQHYFENHGIILAKKKSFFQAELILILGVCKQAKLSYLVHKKPLTDTLKSTQNESMFGEDFVSEA